MIKFNQKYKEIREDKRKPLKEEGMNYCKITIKLINTLVMPPNL